MEEARFSVVMRVVSTGARRARNDLQVRSRLLREAVGRLSARVRISSGGTVDKDMLLWWLDVGVHDGGGVLACVGPSYNDEPIRPFYV